MPYRLAEIIARALAGSALLLAVAAGGRASSSPVPSSEALAAAGWTEPGDGPEDAWSVESPRVPWQPGLRYFLGDTESMPRPQLVRAEARVPVPLAVGTSTMHRVETADGPVFEWLPQLSVRDPGGGFVGVLVDVPPLQVEAPRARPVRRLVLAPDGQLVPVEPSVAPPGSPWPVVRRGPARGRSARQLSDLRGHPALRALHAGVEVARIESPLEDDAFVLTADGGRSWLSIDLDEATRRAGTHELRPAHVRGGAWQGAPAVFAAPRPVLSTATLDLLVAPAAGGAAASLGTVAPDLPWSQELTDVRATDAGLEVLLQVHDETSADAPADSWGVRLRRGDEGRWSEVERFALPGDCRGLELRYDGAGLALWGDGRVVARRPPR